MAENKITKESFWSRLSIQAKIISTIVVVLIVAGAGVLTWAIFTGKLKFFAAVEQTRVVTVATADNLNFEKGKNGDWDYQPNPRLVNGVEVGSWDISAAAKKDGNFGASITGTGKNEWATNLQTSYLIDIDNNADTVYSLSVDVKTAGFNTNVTGNKANLVVLYYDSNNKKVPGNTEGTTWGTIATLTGGNKDWTTISGTLGGAGSEAEIKMPPQADKIAILLNLTGATAADTLGTAYFDNVTIQIQEIKVTPTPTSTSTFTIYQSADIWGPDQKPDGKLNTYDLSRLRALISQCKKDPQCPK